VEIEMLPDLTSDGTTTSWAIDSTNSGEKFLSRKSCASDEGSQRAACDVIVVGHR